ncbi:hypothetical protein SL1157_1798 [Ruegeria lacuscaerulensis ITI-1157]|nr:hypothetical protein SL1157_1798 [Ruegeria lacuscaerulensis ITI-1157]
MRQPGAPPAAFAPFWHLRRLLIRSCPAGYAATRGAAKAEMPF